MFLGKFRKNLLRSALNLKIFIVKQCKNLASNEASKHKTAANIITSYAPVKPKKALEKPKKCVHIQVIQSSTTPGLKYRARLKIK